MTIPRLISFIAFCLLSQLVNATEQVWLRVDTENLVLEVKRGHQTLETFENISIGRNGAGFKQSQGDLVTPLGTYRIGWINNNSHYHKFFGFTYPSELNAFQALSKGLLDKPDYLRIRASHLLSRIPNQNTPIGGNIGIHGLGSASARIHRSLNWTQGCIALTNNQVDRLAQWVDKGMVVKIE